MRVCIGGVELLLRAESLESEAHLRKLFDEATRRAELHEVIDDYLSLGPKIVLEQFFDDACKNGDHKENHASKDIHKD